MDQQSLDLLSPLLTRKEAAAVLRVSPTTIDRLRDEGTLPSRKVGRRVLIKAADVEALLTPLAPAA